MEIILFWGCPPLSCCMARGEVVRSIIKKSEENSGLTMGSIVYNHLTREISFFD